LCIIADCIIPHSGVPLNLSRKNLLKQLSVALWSNNAKMILRYWALQSINIGGNPFST